MSGLRPMDRTGHSEKWTSCGFASARKAEPSAEPLRGKLRNPQFHESAPEGRLLRFNSCCSASRKCAKRTFGPIPRCHLPPFPLT